MFFAACNGIGLALLIPCSQSLIADIFMSDYRGRAFGLMNFISNFGAISGSLFATNIGHLTPFGFEGWRFALHTIAFISIVTGF